MRARRGAKMTLRGLLRQGHGAEVSPFSFRPRGRRPKTPGFGATPSAAIAKPADSAAKRGFWIGPPGPERPRTSARKGASRNGRLTELGFCRPAVGPSGTSGRQDPAGNRTGPSRAYPDPPSGGSISVSGRPDHPGSWRPLGSAARPTAARTDPTAEKAPLPAGLLRRGHTRVANLAVYACAMAAFTASRIARLVTVAPATASTSVELASTILAGISSSARWAM